MLVKPLPTEVFVVAAKRTPFGAFGGKLKSLSATDLGVIATEAAVGAAGLAPAAIDHVIFGNVGQTAADAIYLARHIGLRAGTPVTVPALTVNRLCGSGFQSVVSAAQLIVLGDADIVVAGGSESMSQAPFAARDIRFGVRLGQQPALEDTLWSSLFDAYAGCSMGQTAETVAREAGITREDADAYALRSQRAWAEAQAAGRFSAELAPIELQGRHGPDHVVEDEHPRPQSTIADLARLKPSFGGIVTAGNASGIGDGAGALILASAAAVARHGLRPLARVLQWHVAGVEPKSMGLGPVPAIRGALARAGLELDDMDLIEVNEAFAPQYLAVERTLGLHRERCNVDGGAIALAHPLAASGSRILAHLVHALNERQLRYAIGSACIGGGQGIAVVLERHDS